ncbi:MAG: septum formation initiator family protein [Candidatus Dependentiae bacterium]|nr:septum formation initiator family protein [Candidatus Dependentiae bacterium]
MKEIKRKILRIFFALELLVFTGTYFFAPNGFCAVTQLQEENQQLVAEINLLRADVYGLEHTIVQWDAHPFYKEKIAREQLQMARKGDQIYYVR